MSLTTNVWTKLNGHQFVKEYKPRNEEYPRRTKIVATIGPKTQTVEALEQLIEAGVSVIRMNFSHGDHEFHKTTITNARKAAANKKKIIALMLDTKGPEIRTGQLEGGGEVLLKKDQELILTTEDGFKGNEKKIRVDYKNIVRVLQPGNVILIDDGLIACKVTRIDVDNGLVYTTVLNSGKLGEKKGVNLPNVKVDLPALTEQDKQDLLFGVKQGVDFIAASFVRKPDDVHEIRKVLGSRGESIKIISKIENAEGLENFDEILKVTDGIMVARGDLGVEIPLENVSLAQKMMIAKCNVAGKPVITATQMLETMIVNPRPTRAESTDIANAVLDGTDAVMLSGETAKGEFPFESVRTMAKICEMTESLVDERASYASIVKAVGKVTVTETIASSAVKTANDIGAGLILSLTESGNTARLVAKYRPTPPVVAITQNKETARQLVVSRNVFPVVVGSVIGGDAVIKRVIEEQKQKGVVKSGEYVVVTSGHLEGVAGQTNSCVVLRVDAKIF
jgi:pyruvate kinase